MKPKSIIWVALDVDVDRALYLTEVLNPYVCGFKVGPKLSTTTQRVLKTAESQTSAEFKLTKIRSLYTLIGEDLFWDCKLHDTPNTVAGALAEIAGINPRIFTVHALGGMKMLQVAVANRGSSFVLAVTLLSSLTKRDIREIFGASIRAKILQFTRLAVTAGCDGVVCSPLELTFLHEYEDEFENVIKVTPSIRPKGSPPDDQMRTMTAYDAVMAGADYLVIGRPIIDAHDPVTAIKEFNTEVALAQEHKKRREMSIISKRSQ